MAPGLGRGWGFQGRGPATGMDTASAITWFRWEGVWACMAQGMRGSSPLASLADGLRVLLRLPGMGTQASRADCRHGQL